MAFQFLVAQDWKHFHLAKYKQINKQYTSLRLFIFYHLLITSNYFLIHLYNSLSLWGWQGRAQLGEVASSSQGKHSAKKF